MRRLLVSRIVLVDRTLTTVVRTSSSCRARLDGRGKRFLRRLRHETLSTRGSCRIVRLAATWTFLEGTVRHAESGIRDDRDVGTSPMLLHGVAAAVPTLRTSGTSLRASVDVKRIFRLRQGTVVAASRSFRRHAAVSRKRPAVRRFDHRRGRAVPPQLVAEINRTFLQLLARAGKRILSYHVREDRSRFLAVLLADGKTLRYDDLLDENL